MIFNSYFKKMIKLKRILLILFTFSMLFSSCNKNKEPLYGISIDTSKMIKTPAEIFSLQHIQFFKASNDFALSCLPYLLEKDTSIKVENFAISPFFLHFTLNKDSIFSEYLSSFENHYQISPMDSNEREKFFISFVESVKEIDSSLCVASNIIENNTDSIHIYQKFLFQTHCQEIELPQQLYDSKDKYINISGDFSCLENTEQYLVDIPIGNGNYLLTLIKPKKQHLKEYLKDFDENKYAELLEQTKSIKTNIVFPLMEFNCKDRKINLMEDYLKFSFSLQKKIIIDYDFKIENFVNETISFEKTLLNESNQQPTVFDKDFLFLIRGKNSNFILCIGYYKS